MPSSSTLALAAHQIYVWQQALDVCPDRLERLCATLSPDERDRASRFHDAAISANWIAARGLLRSILARYIGVPPQALSFTYNRFGKPSLQSTGRHRLCFNLAHSGPRMLLAIAREREVGIDLEQLSPGRLDRRLVERLLPMDELRRFDQLPHGAQTSWFLRHWTRLEALLKGQGSGLAGITDWIRHDDSRSFWKTPNRSPSGADWYLRDLKLGRDYVGALAATGAAWRMTMCCGDD